MADYYINSATGDDSTGDGSEGNPWASLDPINDVGFSWSGDDTVYITGDTSCGDAFFYVDDDLTLSGVAGTGTGDNNRPVITLAAGADGFRAVATKSLTISGCDVDGTATTTAVFRLDSNAMGALSITNSTIQFAVWGIYSAVGIDDLDLVNVKFVNSGGNGAAVYIQNCPSGDDILINGCELDMDGSYAGNRGGIIIESNHASTTVAVSNVTGTITTDLASGYNNAVLITDVGTASISDCDVTLTCSNAAAAGSLYTIVNPNIAATAVSIYDCRGYCNAKEGIMIGLGHDTYGAGGDGGEVYGCDVRGPDGFVGLHGIMARDGTGINIYNNRIRTCAIGYLYKLTTGGVCHHNVAEWITDATAAFYMKGATDCVMTGNTHIASKATESDTLLIAEDSGVPTHSTGCIFAGNALYVYPGAGVPTRVITLTDANQACTFYGNNYYAAGSLTFSDEWNDEGTDRTLAEWRAQSHVNSDQSFSFVPRFMGRMDHRILKIIK